MKTIAKNDSEERLVSLRRVRSNNPFSDFLVPKYSQTIYAYYYPDSILSRKVYHTFMYDKSLGKYVEVGFETIYFQREMPYIPPIDTTAIISPIALTGKFGSGIPRNQSIQFSDSSAFILTGDGPPTSTMSPTYTSTGKYFLENDTLIMFVQKSGSLEIEQTLFRYYTDSLVQLSESDLFRNKYHLRLPR